MRTTVKFQMDYPTRAKWDCYIGILPKIDKIVRKLGVDLLTRKTEESKYTVEEVFDYRHGAQFLELTKEIVTLVTKCDLLSRYSKALMMQNQQGSRQP